MDEFTTIKNYPDYEMTICGKIRNVKTKRILKPRLDKIKGYLKVNLYKDKKMYTIEIHRLVGVNLISNPNNLKYIDHIDRNRLNNNVKNLRWSTLYDNMSNRGHSNPILTYCDIIKKFIVSYHAKKINTTFNELNDALVLFKTLL